MKTIFLYIDILGFSELVKTPAVVSRLFRLLNDARIHSDSNYRAIAFSDTIVAYNTHPDLQGATKAVELMFLIELTQELFLRLAGSGIFFRAVITEGNFYHERLSHMDAFYGQALIDTYRAERALVGLGLFLDVALRRFNHVFKWRMFSSAYDFVYLTHYCTGLYLGEERLLNLDEAMADAVFPLPGTRLQASGLEYMIYPEIVHLQEVRAAMEQHIDPAVRAKHRSAWQMYSMEYPNLVRSLERHGMDPKGLADLDWSDAKRRFDEERTSKAAVTVAAFGPDAAPTCAPGVGPSRRHLTDPPART